MIDCTFSLNNRSMSVFKCGAASVPAFSGLGARANRLEFACMAGVGPIPPGTYYIFDRQSGGTLGWVRDLFSGRSEWFALYAIDGKIDDETLCNEIKRGSFRLHPKGPLGISEGCITSENRNDFQRIRSILKNATPQAVPGTELQAYGKVVVS